MMACLHEDGGGVDDDGADGDAMISRAIPYVSVRITYRYCPALWSVVMARVGSSYSASSSKTQNPRSPRASR